MFQLNADEYVIGLTGTYGDVINTVLIYTLRITTNMQSVTFGHVTGPLNFSLTPPAGGQIVGLFGRSGARIDALGVIASAAGTTASDFESVWNSVLLVRTPAVAVYNDALYAMIPPGFFSSFGPHPVSLPLQIGKADLIN